MLEENQARFCMTKRVKSRTARSIETTIVPTRADGRRVATSVEPLNDDNNRKDDNNRDDNNRDDDCTNE
jgi:hypothetical protein